MEGYDSRLSYFAFVVCYKWEDFMILTLTIYITFQVKGVAEKLKSNLEQGIDEDEKEVIDRKNAFGSNTYPKKKGKNFFVSKVFL